MYRAMRSSIHDRALFSLKKKFVSEKNNAEIWSLD